MRIILLALFIFTASNSYSQDICQIAKNPSKYQNILRTKFFKLANGTHDSCVLQILDSLAARVIEKSDTNTLSVLNSICKKSDGYVGEYFEEIAGKIFYENLSTYIHWCLKNKNSCMDYELVLTIGRYASKDKLYNANLQSFIKKERKLHKISSREMRYINQIVRKSKLIVWN